jgi:zinc protease
MFFKYKSFLLSIFFILFTINLNAENQFPIDKAITYGKLDNGFTYYIRENEKPKDKAYIKLVIKAGSVMEEENQLGLAHLLEHMAFNGSTNYPKNALDKFMSSIGLDLGSHYNATTGILRRCMSMKSQQMIR